MNTDKPLVYFNSTNQTDNYSTGSTINISNNSTPNVPEQSTFRTTALYVQFYLTAVFIWIGLACNILAIVCFVTSKTLRRTTTGLYLISLTSSDTVFLIGDAIRWLNFVLKHTHYLGIRFHEDYEFWCKIVYFLRYAGMFISAWIMVAITVERYISIAYPLRASRISTKKNARIVITCVYTCGVVLTLFTFWTIGLIKSPPEYNNIVFCSYINQIEYNRWNWAVIRICSLVLPSVLIFIVTSMIIAKLHQMHRMRLSMVGHNNVNSNLQKQLTLMLVAVAVTFLVLRVPYVISYYLYDFRYSLWNPLPTNVDEDLFAASKITNAFETLNYCINFFMFCFSGSAFRNQFFILLCCGRCGSGSNNAKNTYVQQTMSTSLRSINNRSPLPNRVNTVSQNVNGRNENSKI